MQLVKGWEARLFDQNTPQGKELMRVAAVYRNGHLFSLF